jgi:hypothetical protein
MPGVQTVNFAISNRCLDENGPDEVVAAASGSGEKGHGCDHTSAATFKKNLYNGVVL